MPEADKHGKLEATPFSFRVSKDRKVFIQWQGKQVLILKGSGAEKFIAQIAKANAQQAQLLMAKVTGHFKHGTERSR